MTNSTRQTPEPPAAGELSDEQLLQMAADATGYESIAPGEYESGHREGQGCVVEACGSELIAYGRAVAAAAIAADRARHPQAEQMAKPPAPAARAVLDAAAWSIACATAWLADKATIRAREAQLKEMAEALLRLRRWGGLVPNSPELATRYSCDVVVGVCDWIDAGMTGPLPPLFNHIARREVQSNG